MRYHVFIEGCRDPSPVGHQRLAAALGQRYGLSPPVLSRRLSEGRFRAFASVDRETAERLGRELDELGARVSLIEDPRSNPPGGDASSLPAGPLAGRAAGPDAVTPVPAALSTGERVPDPFAPPDMGDEAELELAARPPRPAASRTTGSPAAAVPATSTYRSGVPARGSETLHGDSFLTRLRDTMAESTRARFLAAVLVAFVVGFIPAQIFAALRHRGAYDEIRAELDTAYRQADTPDAWSALAAARQDARSLADARQRRIAVSACLIWLLVGGAAGFVWWRAIDWEGVRPRIAPAQPREDAAAAARRRVTR